MEVPRVRRLRFSASRSIYYLVERITNELAESLLVAQSLQAGKLGSCEEE